MKPRSIASVGAAALLSLVAPHLAAQAPVEDLARRELGAANFVPADCAVFLSSLRLGEQWQLLGSSNAWRELAALPAVTIGLTGLFASPLWRQLEQLRDDSPEFDGAVTLLGDGLSNEVFVCADAALTPFVQRLAATHLRGVVAGAVGRPGAAERTLLEGLIGLEVPTVLMGMRVGDPARARQLLQFALRELGAVLPWSIATGDIGAGVFHVLRLQAAMVPPDVREQLRAPLRTAGSDADHVVRFDRWLDQLTLAIAVGVRGNHVLVSIGADTRLLERLGPEGCLADAPALAPVRAVLKPRTVSLHYVCPDLSARQPWSQDVAMLWVDFMRDGNAALPQGLLARLQTDLAALFEELSAGCGPVRAEVTVSFLNRGVESFTFLAEQPGRFDSSKPLALLAHGGAAPLLLAASRAPAALPDYLRCVHWVRVGYGYFTDYVLPDLRGNDKRAHERFRDVVLPFLARLDTVTREDLLPSVDGGESLLVLDGTGRLDELGGQALPQPLRYPRPAIVQQLNDRSRFERAVTGCHKALDTLLQQLTEQSQRLPPLTDERAGELQRYVLPPPFPGIVPTALVAPRHLVVALDGAAAGALLAQSNGPQSAVVDLQAPAGAVLHVRMADLLALILDDVEAIGAMLQGFGSMSKHEHDLLRAHLPGLRRALAALRSYTSRTWVEDGLEITHSWTQVEDIAK